MYYELKKLIQKVGPKFDDDNIDRLNYSSTSKLLLLLIILICVKRYVGSPIHCMTPYEYPWSWEIYIERFCFVENTYFVNETNLVYPKREQRGDLKLRYYQWVPLLLSAQMVLFMLVRNFWSAASESSGLDVSTVLGGGLVFADSKSCERFGTGISQNLNFASKNRGTSSLTRSYIFYKFLSCLNVAVQLVFMNRYLNTSYPGWWGIGILWDLIIGEDWKQSGHFPRITFCDFIKRDEGSSAPISFPMQCTLMINAFYEKIYILLWFWLVALGIMNIISTFHWAKTLYSNRFRERYITDLLEYSNVEFKKKDLQKFIETCIFRDGLLSLRLIAINSGDIVASGIVAEMYKKYLNNPDGKKETGELLQYAADMKKFSERYDTWNKRNYPASTDSGLGSDGDVDQEDQSNDAEIEAFKKLKSLDSNDSINKCLVDYLLSKISKNKKVIDPDDSDFDENGTGSDSDSEDSDSDDSGNGDEKDSYAIFVKDFPAFFDSWNSPPPSTTQDKTPPSSTTQNKTPPSSTTQNQNPPVSSPNQNQNPPASTQDRNGISKPENESHDPSRDKDMTKMLTDMGGKRILTRRGLLPIQPKPAERDVKDPMQYWTDSFAASDGREESPHVGSSILMPSSNVANYQPNSGILPSSNSSMPPKNLPSTAPENPDITPQGPYYESTFIHPFFKILSPYSTLAAISAPEPEGSTPKKNLNDSMEKLMEALNGNTYSNFVEKYISKKIPDNDDEMPPLLPQEPSDGIQKTSEGLVQFLSDADPKTDNPISPVIKTSTENANDKMTQFDEDIPISEVKFNVHPVESQTAMDNDKQKVVAELQKPSETVTISMPSEAVTISMPSEGATIFMPSETVAPAPTTTTPNLNNSVDKPTVTQQDLTPNSSTDKPSVINDQKPGNEIEASIGSFGSGFIQGFKNAVTGWFGGGSAKNEAEDEKPILRESDSSDHDSVKSAIEKPVEVFDSNENAKKKAEDHGTDIESPLKQDLIKLDEHEVIHVPDHAMIQKPEPGETFVPGHQPPANLYSQPIDDELVKIPDDIDEDEQKFEYPDIDKNAKLEQVNPILENVEPVQNANIEPVQNAIVEPFLNANLEPVQNAILEPVQPLSTSTSVIDKPVEVLDGNVEDEQKFEYPVTDKNELVDNNQSPAKLEPAHPILENIEPVQNAILEPVQNATVEPLSTSPTIIDKPVEAPQSNLGSGNYGTDKVGLDENEYLPMTGQVNDGLENPGILETANPNSFEAVINDILKQHDNSIADIPDKSDVFEEPQKNIAEIIADIEDTYGYKFGRKIDADEANPVSESVEASVNPDFSDVLQDTELKAPWHKVANVENDSADIAYPTVEPKILHPDFPEQSFASSPFLKKGYGTNEPENLHLDFPERSFTPSPMLEKDYATGEPDDFNLDFPEQSFSPSLILGGPYEVDDNQYPDNAENDAILESFHPGLNIIDSSEQQNYPPQMFDDENFISNAVTNNNGDSSPEYVHSPIDENYGNFLQHGEDEIPPPPPPPPTEPFDFTTRNISADSSSSNSSNSSSSSKSSSSEDDSDDQNGNSLAANFGYD